MITDPEFDSLEQRVFALEARVAALEGDDGESLSDVIADVIADISQSEPIPEPGMVPWLTEAKDDDPLIGNTEWITREEWERRTGRKP